MSFTPVTAHVEPGRLRYFFNTLGESNPVYREAGAPIPPTYLFCLEMMDSDKPFEFLDTLKIDLARVLHGEQSFAYHAPVVVGDTLTFRPKVVSVTDKKGGAMTLIVVQTAVTNEHGAHVADTSRTIVVRNEVAA